MRVLLIDVNCKNSSTGNIVYNLYNYVNSLGDEAAVCYGRGPKIDEKNIYKFGLDAETYLHAFLTRVTGFTGCFSYFSTQRLIAFIKNYKPDVVHIHELHAYFVNIKPLISYLKKNHIRTVMTLHCEFAYTGKCGHSVECEQWKVECRKCPHKREYVSTLWFDRTNYMFKQKKEIFSDFSELSIITPSKWIAERAKDSFLQNHPIRTVTNGIDTAIFYPKHNCGLRKELGISDNEKVVLALAPHLMTQEKGGPFIMELSRILKNMPIRIIMVGVDGTDTKYQNNLIIKGPIYDKNVLASLYSISDLFVICSKRENFPTTCLESQCCGTPVFGFDTGGTKETLVNGYGKLVEYGNTQMLANYIVSADMKNVRSANELASRAMGMFSINVSNHNNYIEYYNTKRELDWK